MKLKWLEYAHYRARLGDFLDQNLSETFGDMVEVVLGMGCIIVLFHEFAMNTGVITVTFHEWETSMRFRRNKKYPFTRKCYQAQINYLNANPLQITRFMAAWREWQYQVLGNPNAYIVKDF